MAAPARGAARIFDQKPVMSPVSAVSDQVHTMIILGAAMGLTNYLIDEEIPMRLLEFFRSHIQSRVLFLVVLNIFLLAVGCTMGIFSALVVVVPLLSPIANAYGIDPIHLGIIFLANLEIGASIPPLG